MGCKRIISDVVGTSKASNRRKRKFGQRMLAGAVALSVAPAVYAQTTSNWTETTTGTHSWQAGPKWSAGVPDGVDHIANVIASLLDGSQTLTLDAPVTLGTLVINGQSDTTGDYTIGLAGESLTFQTSGANAQLTVSNQVAGATVAADLMLNNTLNVINTSGVPVTLSGPIDGSAGLLISTGIANVTGTISYAADTTISGGRLNSGTNTLDLVVTDETSVLGSFTGSTVTVDSLTRGSAALFGIDLTAGAMTVTSGSIGRWVRSGTEFVTLDGSNNVVQKVAVAVNASPVSTDVVRIDSQASPVTLGASTTWDSVIFSGATSQTLDVGSGNQLVLTEGGLWSQSSDPQSITDGSLTAGISSSPAELIVNNAGLVTISSAIVDNSSGGSVSLTKNSAGTLDLTSTSSDYSGGTLIGAGRIRIAGDGSLGAPSAGVDFARSATLEFGASSTLSSSRAISIASDATATFDTGANTATIAGVISGAGALTKTGAGGTLVLSNANTYSGVTHVSAGILQAENPLALGNTSGITAEANSALRLRADADTVFGPNSTTGYTLNVTGNLTLDVGALDNSDPAHLNKTLTLGQAHWTAGSFTLDTFDGHKLAFQSIRHSGSSGHLTMTVNAPVGTPSFSYEATNNKTFTFNVSGSNTVNIGSGGVVQTSSGVMSLTKSGTGTMLVDGPSTYSGITTISAGVMQISDPTALGVSTAANAISMAANSRLHLRNDGADVTFGPGSGYNVTITGTPVTIDVGRSSGSGTNVLRLGALAATTQSLNVVGDGNTTLVFNGVFTLTGGTGTNLIYPSTASLTVDSITANLTSIRTLLIGSDLTTSHQKDASEMTIVGGITQLSAAPNNLALTKSGTGALTIGGTSNYRGNTVINFGTINANAAGALGGVGAVNVFGQASQPASTTVLNANATNALTGTNSLTVGTGTNVATANLNFANNYSGNTVLNSGSGNAVLNFGHHQAFGTGNLILNGGTIATSAPLTGPVTNTILNLANLTYGGDHAMELTSPVNLNGTRTFNVTNTSAGGVKFSGDLSNGSLVKNGPGTLVLGVQNTYAGSTTVNAGTLVLEKSFTNSSSLAVANGARVELTPRNSPAKVLKLNTLNLNTSGTLDLNDNDLIVDYTGASPYADLMTLVTQGFSSTVDPGKAGIVSSTSQAQGGDTILALVDNAAIGGFFTNWLGQPVDFDTVIGKYTYFGDANLDGQVTGDDFAIAVSNLGMTGALWIHGDMNFDGAVTGDDVTIIISNLGKGVGNPLGATSLSGSVVPEPGGIALLAMAGATTLMRRRRRP